MNFRHAMVIAAFGLAILWWIFVGIVREYMDSGTRLRTVYSTMHKGKKCGSSCVHRRN